MSTSKVLVVAIWRKKTASQSTEGQVLPLLTFEGSRVHAQEWNLSQRRKTVRLHSNNSENILLMNDHIKLADFGSCKGVYSRHPYTEYNSSHHVRYISTRWYRAPECLLTDGYYDFKMDLWGVGCVMFEIIALFPLFPGNNELDQVHKIHNILGTPSANVLDRFRRCPILSNLGKQPTWRSIFLPSMEPG
jgi:serine/threonine protein kinase